MPAQDLRCDVDIVGTRKIVGLRAAQKPEAVGQDFDHAIAVDRRAEFGLRLQDREHQVRSAQCRRCLDVQLLGHREKFSRGLAFEILEIHGVQIFRIGFGMASGMPVHDRRADSGPCWMGRIERPRRQRCEIACRRVLERDRIGPASRVP